MKRLVESTLPTGGPGLQSQSLDHVAALTRMRDRDRLDEGLASALHELISPRSVSIYRPVGEAQDRRWLPRARVCRGKLDLSFDATWAGEDSLALLADQPQRAAALSGQVVTFDS